jgi:hypothetical protein
VIRPIILVVALTAGIEPVDVQPECLLRLGGPVAGAEAHRDHDAIGTQTGSIAEGEVTGSCERDGLSLVGRRKPKAIVDDRLEKATAGSVKEHFRIALHLIPE